MRRKRFIVSGLSCSQEQKAADEAAAREEADAAAAEASKGKKAKKDDKKKATAFKIKQVYELDDFGAWHELNACQNSLIKTPTCSYKTRSVNM